MEPVPISYGKGVAPAELLSFSLILVIKVSLLEELMKNYARPLFRLILIRFCVKCLNEKRIRYWESSISLGVAEKTEQ